MASAKAMPMIMGRKTVPLASGLRPIASMALLPRMPIPMPGPIAPRPMARPTARGVKSMGLRSSFLLRARCLVGLVSFRVRFAVAVGRSQREEGDSQDREDECLYDSDEELKEKGSGWDDRGSELKKHFHQDEAG